MVKALEDAGAAMLVLRSLYEEEVTGEQMAANDITSSTADHADLMKLVTTGQSVGVPFNTGTAQGSAGGLGPRAVDSSAEDHVIHASIEEITDFGKCFIGRHRAVRRPQNRNRSNDSV